MHIFRTDLMFFHFNIQRRRQLEQKKIEEEEEEIRQFGQAKKVTVVNIFRIIHSRYLQKDKFLYKWP